MSGKGSGWLTIANCAAVAPRRRSLSSIAGSGAKASVEEGIRQGRDDVADGRIRLAADAFDEVRAAPSHAALN